MHCSLQQCIFRFQYFVSLPDVSEQDWPSQVDKEHILFKGNNLMTLITKIDIPAELLARKFENYSIYQIVSNTKLETPVTAKTHMPKKRTCNQYKVSPQTETNCLFQKTLKTQPACIPRCTYQPLLLTCPISLLIYLPSTTP